MGFFSFLFGSIFGGRKTVSVQTKNLIQSDWDNINISLKGGTPAQLRQALIRADKTVDAALKDLVVGNSMGERLKNARDLFDKRVYNSVWEAHKVRNALVHEAGYEPPYHVLKRKIDDLKVGLKDLGVNVK